MRGGMFVWTILFNRIWWLTVSKAFNMSRAIAIVLLGGLFWLNPVIIWLVRVCSAVVVEWACLKPCWWAIVGMLFVISGRIIFSRILAIGESSDIGRKEEPICLSLLGLGIGMIFDVFHICGMVLVLSAMLYICVR